jgi:hypothetical protein
MKKLRTWLIATISTSVGIALGMLLAPGKKSKKCSPGGNNGMDKIRKPS